MKRALILCLFWAISLNAGANAGNCATNWFPPLQPMGTNGFPNNSGVTSLADPFVTNNLVSDANISYPKISEVERALYGQNFTAQDILLRLARIENSLFSTSYPNLNLAQRVDNIIMNFNQINEFPNISKNTLSIMEAKVLSRSYAQNNVQNRIERLEQQIFGAVQSGDLTARFETLTAAAQDYNQNQYATGYNQNPLARNQLAPNYLAQSALAGARGGWKGIVGSLGGMLLGGGMGGGLRGGALTGFTPPIDPYNSCNSYNNNNNGNCFNNFSNIPNSGYNNFAGIGSPNGYGSYNGLRTNRGYSDAFNSYGSGSKVTILD